MEKLEKEMPVLLCKLKKIFQPGCFNPMQHLLIHLAYEAKVGGPVQYRWIYHIERALKKLRPMVGNKARVEGCIAEQFKYKEIAYFISVYFAEDHKMNSTSTRYHTNQDLPCSDLDIFGSDGIAVGVGKTHHLTQES